MLVLLESVRREARSNIVLEYHYKLFELRDELRNHVIQNPELAKSWVFLYLDSTITKLGVALPSLSIWQMMAIMLSHRKDPGFKRHRMHLEREYSKAKNAKFKQIELKLMATVGQYLNKKHAGLHATVTKASLVLAFQAAKGCLGMVKKLRKSSLEAAVEAPETSTLREYCPA